MVLWIDAGVDFSAVLFPTARTGTDAEAQLPPREPSGDLAQAGAAQGRCTLEMSECMYGRRLEERSVDGEDACRSLATHPACL